MKLLLTSAGLSTEEIKENFLKILPKKPEEIKVYFIPTAANPEVNKFYIEKSLNQLKEIGIKNIETLDIENKKENELFESLSQSDVIFVNGGNTFYLLDQIRKSEFDQIIKRLLSEGKIYVGVSAGSYVCCPTIETALWKNMDKNIVGLKDLTGMNVINFMLFVHYEEKYKYIVEEKLKQIKYPLIVLTDKQAVLVEAGKLEVIGEGEKIIYNFQ